MYLRLFFFILFLKNGIIQLIDISTFLLEKEFWFMSNWKELYPMINCRRSSRKYDLSNPLSKDQLSEITDFIKHLEPLVEDIRVEYRLVERKKTTCRFGEYVLVIYSEKKPRYLNNVGYMFEQFDLFCAKMNIGTCWHGLGKPDLKEWHGLESVIMITLGNVSSKIEERDLTKIKRKDVQAFWEGDIIEEVSRSTRLSPSACNSQPWQVKQDNGVLRVYQNNKNKSIIPKKYRNFYHSIDLGIFLCILELSLINHGIEFNRVIEEVNIFEDIYLVMSYQLDGLIN